jgi:Na+/H+-dicarboxylate symporter
MASDILITLIVFSSLFGIVFVFLTTRNKERLALIDKGADAKLFNSGKKLSFGELVLNLALLAIGIGTGVLVGAMFEQNGMEEGVAFTSSIFIFGGIGLMASFFLNRKLSQKID